MTETDIMPFAFPGLPTRIEFGRGARHRLAEAAERAGFKRALVITTMRGADVLAEINSSAPMEVCGVFLGARVHVPAPTVREALDVAATARADGAIAIGGGSSIGLAKALAHYTGLPYIALPTTLSGSEMTSVWGETTNGHKRTARDEKVRPREVVYDPELLASMPSDLAVQSAINALAHVAESAYAANTSPLVQSLAGAGADAIAGGLQDIVGTASPRFDRLLYGAMLGGMCLSSAAMSLHHKLCHVIGGALDLPHAATHAIVLPHVLALNLPAAAVANGLLVRAFGSGAPERRIQELLRKADAPGSLAELGAPRSALIQLADRVVEELGAPQANPVSVTTTDVEGLLQRAWAGADAVR